MDTPQAGSHNGSAGPGHNLPDPTLKRAGEAAPVFPADVPSHTVLGRAMAVLGSFDFDDRSLGLAELVRRTGLPKTTVHRLCAELVTLGILARDSRGAFRLGRRLFELGMRASLERHLIDAAMPFLQDLYSRTRATVHLGVREDTELVYVSKIGGHRQARAPSLVGGRMPLHCTAIGKVLLAFGEPELIGQVLSQPLERRTRHTITAPGILKRQLDRVLAEGVAYEHEESTSGLACVAAPILDREDRPVAAVSVTGSVPGFVPYKHRTAVQAASTGIASMLARRDVLASE